MSEIAKTVGQLMVNNLSMTMIIILFVLSGFFRIAKKEVDPLKWIAGKVGGLLTKEVRKDISDFKTETHGKFDEIKTDRAAKIDELKNDYNDKISALREDLDSFEERTKSGIDAMKTGTALNCETLKARLDQIETAQQKSNDMQTVRTIRSHVLDFANSCFNKRKHTKREFENIIDENAKYEELVRKYELKNNVYKEDYDFIMKVYHKCQEEGSFLKDGD